MKEHLNQLQANARLHLKTSGQAAFIRKQCEKVETKLRNRNRRVERLPKTPGSRKSKWVLCVIDGVAHTLAPDRPHPWVEDDENYLKQAEGYWKLQYQKEKLIKNHFADRWQSS